ncbi:tetratricopeptide repeat protein [Pseudomonas citronellolis]|uniref:tetratricopeptide repeat protein n=1 Tax=Pseudomonas citronellolis TaxID=53408 RepID=UPI0023E3A0A7|nr:tetratricopeptide repeat protein [Pseudomonas citronellolis]MDF3934924.1 tetratricopeptide repeat protein [Pseudomonas citronellolis]
MAFVLRRREELSVDQLRTRLASDPRQAAAAILEAARLGELEAQALLGQILLDGQGIERDPALALTWFRIAAERGHGMARNMLGRCLEHGWGTAANPAAAAEHYAHAAAEDLDWGLYNLANLLATGRGVPRDAAHALALYRRAADLGHAKSMNLVGRHYEEGLCVARDTRQARDWYRRSAVAGDFRGQFSHAAALAEQGQVEDARYWLLRALEGGNLNFLRVAREQLEHAPQPELRELALAYYRRAAELGETPDGDLYAAALKRL